MTPYACYIKYLALKAHFDPNKSYDYIKYSGVIRASEDAFQTRRDKYFFSKLSKKNDPVDRLVSVLVEKHDTWIGDIINEHGEATYKNWKARQDNMSYSLGNVVSALDGMEGGFKAQFEVNGGAYPSALQYYNQGYMSHEVFLALNTVLKFVPKWNESLDDDIIWPRIMYKLKQYRPFVNIDKDKIISIIDKKVML